eukprot:778667-Prymnesium_polylepis.1
MAALKGLFDCDPARPRAHATMEHGSRFIYLCVLARGVGGHGHGAQCGAPPTLCTLLYILDSLSRASP